METEIIKSKLRPIFNITMSNFIEAAFWLIFVVAFLIKCSQFQFSTNINKLPFYTPWNLNMLLATLSTVMLFVGLTFLIFNRKRLIALLVIDIILSLLLFADNVYFRYYYNALSVPVLYQIGLVGSIKDSIKSLLKLSDIVFFIDIPFFIAGLILYRRKVESVLGKIHILKRLAVSALILLVSFCIFQFTYRESDARNFAYDNNYTISNLGICYFHYYDVKRFIKEHIFADNSLSKTEESKIKEYYKNKKTVSSNYKGTAKGKNLIVVQVEALQQFVINKKIDGKEVTPNLNKFINDSAYFENFYYQIGNGNTSDSEFLTNTSLYPVREGAVYFRYPSNTYESTANILNKQGYNTYAFHANNPSFWNRTVMYKALGFESFYSSNDFKIDEKAGWGLGDKSFLKQSLEKLDTTKPFYGFFITLSSHHPFSYFQDYEGFNVGNYEKTFAGNYLKAVNYVDQAIGQFFEELKQKGLYDNSVIVIYGDHNAILKDQTDVIEALFGKDLSELEWTKLQKTPCFIRFPGMDKKGTQSITAGEIDILPTVANLMGVEAPYALGKDLFNTDKGYAVLRNGTVITDDYVYINGDDKVYNSNGTVSDINSYDNEIKEYRNQLSISDIIIAKNVLKDKQNLLK